MKILAIAALALVALSAAPAQAANNVGFQEITVPDGADKPLVVGVWYPTHAPASDQRQSLFVQHVAPGGPVAGRGLALVVMSHGNNGYYDSNYDTAVAMAQAGFVVAAVSHTGDTYLDQSRATRMADRPRHIHVLIDYMLSTWSDHGRIDPNRVGVFGHSSGGFTALVASGGVPDFSGLAAHCEQHPDFYDCQLAKRAHRSTSEIAASDSDSDWMHDPRIKAAVLEAPALGFTFTPAGLANVKIPVQLWRAENDQLLPSPFYVEPVRAGLPRTPEYHVVPDAGHFDFLAPCTPALAAAAPAICKSAPGFDRQAFHTKLNHQIVAFFRSHLIGV
jgi:predicted dienelactone hydrolase